MPTLATGASVSSSNLSFKLSDALPLKSFALMVTSYSPFKVTLSATPKNSLTSSIVKV